jgi:acyl dehydratase
MRTYGVASRLIVHALRGGDATRLRGTAGRFSKPAMPGDTLTMRIRADGGRAQFQTVGRAGNVLLDRGTFTFEGASRRSTRRLQDDLDVGDANGHVNLP